MTLRMITLRLVYLCLEKFEERARAAHSHARLVNSEGIPKETIVGLITFWRATNCCETNEPRLLF